MNIKNLIEGGIAGATTLSMLQEVLHKIDGGAPRPLLHKSGAIKQLKSGKKHKSKANNELFIKLAGDLVANAAYFGLAGIGKKKNAVLRGGLLGAAAGLGSAFLADEHKIEKHKLSGADEPHLLGAFEDETEPIKDKVLTVLLYTAGGVLAGAAIKQLSKKSKKKGKVAKALKWLKKKK